MAVEKMNSKAKVKKKSKAKSVKNQKAAIVAQEIKFTRLLANGSDKKVTEKALKSLQKWLSARSQSNYAFTETDFLRLWKGLFYCMWMSDKPLLQEETAETISNLVHCLKTKDNMLMFIKSALKSLSTQWFGIDKYRVDKFEMLLRRIIRQALVVIRNQTWDMSYVKDFAKILEELLLDSNSLGMILQIHEVFMEELAKISGGDIPIESVTELLRPFALYVASKTENREIKSAIKNVFRYLIFQSDVGLDYQDKFNAWKAAGFPCKSIKDVQRVELSDEEEGSEYECDDEKEVATNCPVYLDPRAGRVNVELPQIPFDAKQIIGLLKEYKTHKSSTVRSRKYISQLIEEFEELSMGEMPLGIKEVTLPKKRKSNAFSKRATSRLLEFDSDLYSDTIRKKKRKRKLSDTTSPLNNEKESQSESLDGAEEKKSMKKKMKKGSSAVENSEKKLKTKMASQNRNLMGLTKKKKAKVKNKSPCKSSFSVEDVVPENLNNTKEGAQESKCSTTNGWNVSESKQTSSPLVMTHSLTPVIEKLDISQTDFFKEISRKTGAMKKANKQTKASPVKIPSASLFRTPTKSIGSSPSRTPTKGIVSTPSTKVLNPMAVSLRSDTKKRVKIVLQRNTAQHTSEYLRQLKQSPAIPYDANRKPLTSVLKASPIPSPINPFKMIDL